MGRKRQIFMGCRQCSWVKQFAVGRHGSTVLTPCFFPIPRCQACLFIGLSIGDAHRHIIPALDGIGSIFHVPKANCLLDRESIDRLNVILHQGILQWSTDDFKGKLADAVNEFGRLSRKLIGSSHDPYGSFNGSLNDTIARLDRREGRLDHRTGGKIQDGEKEKQW